MSARAEEAVGTSTAPFDADIDADSASEVAAAEAVVYVFTQAVRADDVRALEAFRAASARLASSPINALGVFGKVDTLVGGAGDPWPVAGPLADQQAALLARTVSEVVPVVGLLAETGESGRLTSADCAALRQLAAAAATWPCCWRRWTCSGPGPRRSPPSTANGCWRCSTCTASASRSRSSPRTRSWAPVSWCAGWCRRPGSRGCGSTLEQTFRWRSDAIKAGWALARLERLAGHTADRGDREALRDGVEQLLREPDYHRLRLLEVAQRVATGAVPMPVAWEQELTRLATSDDARWILRLPERGRRPAGRRGPGGGEPVAGVRGGRRRPGPVAGRAGRAPRVLPAEPAGAAVKDLDSAVADVLAYVRTADPDAGAELAELRRRQLTRPSVVLVGETKRGKSSLVNALLGRAGAVAGRRGRGDHRLPAASPPARRRAKAWLPGASEPVDVTDLAEWATGDRRARAHRGHPPGAAAAVRQPARHARRRRSRPGAHRGRAGRGGPGHRPAVRRRRLGAAVAAGADLPGRGQRTGQRGGVRADQGRRLPGVAAHRRGQPGVAARPRAPVRRRAVVPGVRPARRAGPHACRPASPPPWSTRRGSPSCSTPWWSWPGAGTSCNWRTCCAPPAVNWPAWTPWPPPGSRPARRTRPRWPGSARNGPRWPPANAPSRGSGRCC